MPRWKKRTQLQRFFGFVNFGFGEDACWNWIGAYHKDGYGSFGEHTSEDKWKSVLAHRFIYQQLFGVIDSDIEVCHKCDNPACVNPQHLFLGSHNDNIQDMRRKGRERHNKGENNHKAKLTTSIVLEIRNLYSLGNISQRKLARKYGVSQTHIGYIIKRQSWSWLR